MKFLWALTFILVASPLRATSRGLNPRYSLEVSIEPGNKLLKVQGTIDCESFQSDTLVLSPHCSKPIIANSQGVAIDYETASVDGDGSPRWPGQRFRRRDKEKWKGLLQFNYECKSPSLPKKETRSDFTIGENSFRLSEATNWYPTFPMGENNTPSTKGLGQIKISCNKCSGQIWANAQTRIEKGPHKVEAVYKIPTDFHIWSYPDLKTTVRNSLAGPLFILSLSWNTSDVEKIKKYVEDVMSFYELEFGKINRKESLFFSQIKPNPSREGWAYSASANAFMFSADGVKPGEFQPEKSSIAHELAHRYFDGQWPIVGEKGRAFLSESFAETLGQAFMLSKKKPRKCASIESDRNNLRTQLKDVKISPLVSARYADEHYSTLVYEFGPLVLWDFCQRVSYEKFQTWIRQILSVENKSISFETLRASGKKTGISDSDLDWFESTLEKAPAKYFE